MPLAEAVLLLWRWVTRAERLQPLWDHHRGKCYDRVITFPVMVQLIADALLQYGGSGRRSFAKGKKDQVLQASIPAAFGKLGRLPIAVSQAFLSDCTAALRELFADPVRRQLPASLQGVELLTLDGKAIKRVAKRLLPLRGIAGGLLGGRALVAMEWSTGLAIAMHADADGDANDVRFVAALVPPVRRRVAGPRLWMGDCAFCDLDQPERFTTEGDHFLVRYHPKVKFERDPKRMPREGTDELNRPYVEDWGWLGRVQDNRRRYVRRIVLPLKGQDLILLTDLLDETSYPSRDLLGVYRERFRIEHMFQEVTEVFGLRGLIGGKPQACIFQFAFCLLLYNMIQVIRSFVAATEDRKTSTISTEKLFDDVKRQLIAWNIMVDVKTTVAYFDALSPTSSQLRQRLEELLGACWSDEWEKPPKQQHHNKTHTKRERTHGSVFRILEAFQGQADKGTG